jgi:hypothetical protein
MTESFAARFRVGPTLQCVDGDGSAIRHSAAWVKMSGEYFHGSLDGQAARHIQERGGIAHLSIDGAKRLADGIAARYQTVRQHKEASICCNRHGCLCRLGTGRNKERFRLSSSPQFAGLERRSHGVLIRCTSVWCREEKRSSGDSK